MEKRPNIFSKGVLRTSVNPPKNRDGLWPIFTQMENNDGHYFGFWVDWYDDLLKNETKDIELYTGLIADKDAPVFEIACGTGRLLLEFLKRGIVCDGLDMSGPMLDLCRKKLTDQNLQSTLYQADVLDFDFPKTYKTIFVSGGSFQLIPSFDEAVAVLQKIYQAIDEGGKFICDLWIPWDEIIANETNTWKVGRVSERDDGSKLVVSYFKQFNLEQQFQTGEFKYELYQDGELIRTQIDDIKMKWYGVDEFRLMLQKAGFENISVSKQKVMSSHGISTLYIAEK